MKSPKPLKTWIHVLISWCGRGFFNAWGMPLPFAAFQSFNLLTFDLLALLLEVMLKSICKIIFVLCSPFLVVGKAWVGMRRCLVAQSDSATPLLDCCLIFQVLWGENSWHLHRRGFCIIPVKILNNCWTSHKPELFMDLVLSRLGGDCPLHSHTGFCSSK